MPNPETSEAGVCSSHSTPPQGPRVQHGGPISPQDQSRDLLAPVQSMLPSLNHQEGLARHTPQRRPPRPRSLHFMAVARGLGPRRRARPPSPATTKPLLQAHSGSPGEAGRPAGLPLHTKCTRHLTKNCPSTPVLRGQGPSVASCPLSLWEEQHLVPTIWAALGKGQLSPLQAPRLSPICLPDPTQVPTQEAPDLSLRYPKGRNTYPTSGLQVGAPVLPPTLRE